MVRQTYQYLGGKIMSLEQYIVTLLNDFSSAPELIKIIDPTVNAQKQT